MDDDDDEDEQKTLRAIAQEMFLEEAERARNGSAGQATKKKKLEGSKKDTPDANTSKPKKDTPAKLSRPTTAESGLPVQVLDATPRHGNIYVCGSSTLFDKSEEARQETTEILKTIFAKRNHLVVFYLDKSSRLSDQRINSFFEKQQPNMFTMPSPDMDPERVIIGDFFAFGDDVNFDKERIENTKLMIKEASKSVLRQSATHAGFDIMFMCNKGLVRSVTAALMIMMEIKAFGEGWTKDPKSKTITHVATRVAESNKKSITLHKKAQAILDAFIDITRPQEGPISSFLSNRTGRSSALSQEVYSGVTTTTTTSASTNTNAQQNISGTKERKRKVAPGNDDLPSPKKPKPNDAATQKNSTVGPANRNNGAPLVQVKTEEGTENTAGFGSTKGFGNQSALKDFELADLMAGLTLRSK